MSGTLSTGSRLSLCPLMAQGCLTQTVHTVSVSRSFCQADYMLSKLTQDCTRKQRRTGRQSKKGFVDFTLTCLRLFVTAKKKLGKMLKRAVSSLRVPLVPRSLDKAILAPGMKHVRLD
jgi:hypothetical protein